MNHAWVFSLFLLGSPILAADTTVLKSPIFEWLQDSSLKCYYASKPTRVAAGLDACLGRVYCENKLTGTIIERGTIGCKVDGQECPSLEYCADPKNQSILVAVSFAEASKPTTDDLVRTDIHGRECNYETADPKALWVEYEGEMFGVCGTPIKCKGGKEELPTFAVCEAITPPTKPALSAPENQNRKPFPILECPRVNSCIKKAIESYPAAVKQGAAGTTPPTVLTSQPASSTSTAATRSSGSVARGLRGGARPVPARGASRNH